MKFTKLCSDALEGKLHIPEFQRDFKWKTKQVMQLFDSMRAGFPIGAMLLMEPNDELRINPRPLFKDNTGGIEIEPDESAQARLILDGQQRITSGLILFHHQGTSAYFVSLATVEEFLADIDAKMVKRILDGERDDDLRDWVTEQMRGLDYDSTPYLKRRNLLIKSANKSRSQYVAQAESRVSLGEVPTWMLWEPKKQGKVHDELGDAFEDEPGRARLYQWMVRECVPEDHEIPLEVLGSDQPVEAITRIFEKINNTGLALTPLELVVAVLYPNQIQLRSLIDSAHNESDYLSNVDPEGIGVLQVMALKNGLSPKKASMPRTVLEDRVLANFNSGFAEAVEDIDAVSKFLSDRMGAALDITSKLLPYEAMIPPMAVAWRRARDAGRRTEAEKLIERWFVLGALQQRYQEGTHNKQANDVDDFAAWLDGTPPAWVREFRTPALMHDSLHGAVGRLVQCLINRNNPRDPVTNTRVGFPTEGDYVNRKGDTVSHTLNIHHIFPKDFAGKTLKVLPAEYDVVLNTMFLTKQTNLDWKGHDPATHLMKLGGKSLTGVSMGEFASQFVSESAIAILARPQKSASDLDDFLRARRDALLDTLSHWGVPKPDVDADEADEDLAADLAARDAASTS